MAQQTPFAGALPIPGTLQAENYDRGGNNIAWFDTSAGNAFGSVYRTDDMDVGAIPAGGYHIGALANGEWAEYTLNVATTGVYNVTLRWASDFAGPNTFKLYQDGVLLTTQSAEKTSQTAGDWHRYLTKTFTVNLTAGTRILKVEFTAGAWNFDSLVFAAQSCAAPVFTQPLPGSQTVNTPGITFTLTAQVTGASTYQWLKNGNPISGQTTKTLTLLGVEEGKDVGAYTLRATSSCGASTTSNTFTLFRVRCSASPGHNSENLYRALAGLPDFCYWQEDKGDNFPLNGTNYSGSFNKPVISGAVAYIKGYPLTVNPPIYPTSEYKWWWYAYLRGELGKSGAGSAWHYGGNEIGSFTYQQFNIISVLAVAYHANLTGETALRDLAWEWLRNTFTIHALIAAPTNLWSTQSQGHVEPARVNYTGPYIAMAGERSDYTKWDLSDRSILFSQAVGFGHNGQGETIGIRHTREYIEPRLANAYGLNNSQKTVLRNIVSTGDRPADLIGNYLSTTLRTRTRYHIVAWQSPQIVRLTLMEASNHTTTAPTFGAVYFTNPRSSSGREAHMLWPWSGLWLNENYKLDVTKGTGTINLNSALISATQPGSPTHPQMTETISGLPSAASRKYWIVLSPNAPPAVQ